MAGQSAAQCGPCVFGLRAIADATARVAAGQPGARTTLPRLERWSEQIAGRGACRHPDGAVGQLAELAPGLQRRVEAPPAPPPVQLRAQAARRDRATGGGSPDAGRPADANVGSDRPARVDRPGTTRVQLIVDRIACDGYGMCAELLPELIDLDDWGYPIIRDGGVPDALLDHARRAVAVSPGAGPPAPPGTCDPEAMRILVAEDDRGLRDVIVLGLTDSGYHVDAVERGDDAIDQLRFYEYDVAILDWRMPGARGHRRRRVGPSPQAPDGDPDADRPRHAGRPDPRPRHAAPTTTS